MVVLFVYETGSMLGLAEAWTISHTALTIYVLLYLWRRIGLPVFLFRRTKYLLKLSSPLYLASRHSSTDRLSS